MGLKKLPPELLLSLPHYLSNIEDFTNAASSCRTLRSAFQTTQPNCILRLAASSSRVFFQPNPWFLVAATARQVGEWGLQSNENTEILRTAFRGGINTLMELCISKAGLTMDDIRRLHVARFELIDPISDTIARMAGRQRESTPDFWSGGVSEAFTVDCEPIRTLLQFVIYGELFESTLQVWLEGSHVQRSKYCLAARFDFVRYCIPFWTCYDGSPGLGSPQRETGPYKDRNSEDADSGDGLALYRVVLCGGWDRPWAAVREQIGPDFEEGWRQDIWVQAVQLHGLWGLEILRPGGVEKWRERLLRIWRQVGAMESQPDIHWYGDNAASQCPNLADELLVCIGGV